MLMIMKLLSKKVNRRAQSSIEFVILVGAVLFFFITLLFVFQQTLSSKLLQQRNTEFLELAKNVQNEIALAAGTSDGYQRNFFIPDKIFGVDYAIIIQDEVIYISSE